MKILSMFSNSSTYQKQLEEIRPKLYRLAFSWCHNSALADDLVQETMIKALKNANQLRDPALMNSWLFRILANCWRDHFRLRIPTRDADEFEDNHYVNEITPEDEHAQSQLISHVWKAVGKLPMGQRQVLTLVDLEEFPYIEVAAILSIPIGTVMSRLCRARQALKPLLKELAPQQSAHVTHIRRIM
jgi:RNA polymerase sigma-70 factor (ECF subfamily)